MIFLSIKNASGEELLIWADFSSVGEASFITTPDVVVSSNATVAEAGEVWVSALCACGALVPEVEVGTIGSGICSSITLCFIFSETLWSESGAVVHSVVIAQVERGLIALVSIQILEPVSPVLDYAVSSFILGGKLSIGICCVLSVNLSTSFSGGSEEGFTEFIESSSLSSNEICKSFSLSSLGISKSLVSGCSLI